MTDDNLAALRTELSPGDALEEVAEPELKWPALTVLERGLTVVCGLILVGFTSGMLLDVITRASGAPVNGLQNFILGSFVWGIFLGAAVGHRRAEHFRLAAIAMHFQGVRRQLFETLEHGVVIAVAIWMTYFGYLNVLSGMDNYLQPTEVPLATVTAAIPVSGALIALFSVERLIHVWRRAFPPGASPTPLEPSRGAETDPLLAPEKAGSGE